MRRFWTTLLALPLAFASCSDMPEADTKPAAGTIEVSIGSGPKIDIRTEAQTRTELGEDGVTVQWADNDCIALWAVDSQGQETIDQQVFKLWHYNEEYNTAKFTATVPEMPEDTYTYYAVSPVPFEANRLEEALYRIPAEQNGTFNGDYDIMVAHPIEGSALQQGDNSQTVNLQFEHKVHVLKIHIPSNNLGEDISKITLTFPEPVAGVLKVNGTDPTAAPQLTSGSNVLTLTFDTPKKPGDTVFAVIAPVELTSAQSVTITATGTTRESRPREFAGKNFTAGHTTPIAFNIPTVGPTTLRIHLSNIGDEKDNNGESISLGEKIEKFTLTAAEGVDLGEGSNVRVFPVETAGNFDFVFEEFPENLAGQSVAVSYESENALLSGGSFTIPDFMAGETKTITTLSVPYLMEEDFSTLNDDFSVHDNQALGVNLGSGADSGYSGTTDLSTYGLPSGWTAGRVGGQKGTSIRICGREEAGGKYPGRLDSAPLSGIKAGHTVTIKVSFNYSGDKNEYKGWGGKTGDTIFAYGYTTEQEAFNGNTNLHNTIKSNIVLSTGGSYTNIPNSNKEVFTLSNCGNTHRLSWQASTNKANALIQNGNYWLYLDNIKVSIVPATNE